MSAPTALELFAIGQKPGFCRKPPKKINRCGKKIGCFSQRASIYMEQGREHSGIVTGRQSYSVGEQLRGFLRLISEKSAEEMISQQEFLGNYID